MPCALDTGSSPQRRDDAGAMRCAPPCGYCLKASMTVSGCFVLFTLWSQCQALGQALVSAPIKETFAKPAVIPAQAGIYVKMQLERLRITAYYRCSTEFCKGLHQGRGGFGQLVLSCSPVLPCRPVDSRLRGNDGEGRENDRRLCTPLLWIADQVRNDVTMLGHEVCPSLWILP